MAPILIGAPGAIVLLLLGCSGGNDAEAEPSGGNGFAQKVFPLLESAGCSECHREDNTIGAHWALTTPEDTYFRWVKQPGFDHCDSAGGAIEVPEVTPRVVPGEPDASLVLKKLTDPWESCGPFMGHMPPPPRPRLTVDQVSVIRSWIADGALP